MAASWKLQSSSELIDRHCSFNVRGHPRGGRDGARRTLTGQLPRGHFTVQTRTAEGREERRVEVGKGSSLFFSFVVAFKPGFTCWKNVFLVGWFWSWRKAFSLYPPTSRSWLFHMVISCLPRAALEDWTWDLSCNSFFYVSTPHTWRLNSVSLSSCGSICFLLFPVGVRHVWKETPFVNHALVNLGNSGSFYKELVKLCRDTGRVWSF